MEPLRAAAEDGRTPAESRPRVAWSEGIEQGRAALRETKIYSVGELNFRQILAADKTISLLHWRGKSDIQMDE